MVAFAPNAATAFDGGFKSFTSGAASSEEFSVFLLLALFISTLCHTSIGTITFGLLAVIDVQVWMLKVAAKCFIATHDALFIVMTSLLWSTFGWAKHEYTYLFSADKVFEKSHHMDHMVNNNDQAVVTGAS